jgi:hypothetical protein
LQGAALVHGSGRDDAAFVRDFLETGKFAWGELHENPPEYEEDECWEVPIIVNQCESKSGVLMPYSAAGIGRSTPKE